MPMDPTSESERATEQLLRAARPDVRDGFVERTEQRLLGRRPATSRRSVLLPAFGLGLALAVAALVASLGGAGPLALSGSDDVRARQDCKTVIQQQSRTVGEIVRDGAGVPRVITRDGPVLERRVECR